MNPTRLFLASIAAAALAQPAAADPIRITGGFLDMDFERAETRFVFTGGVFTAIGILPPDESGGLTLTFAPTPRDAVPGALVDLSSHVSLSAYDFSEGVFTDRRYQVDFTFTTEATRLDSSLTATAPFTAAGTLAAINGQTEFLQLVGRGTATFSFLSCLPEDPLSGCLPQPERLTYSFGADTVPEPATFLLLSGAVVMLMIPMRTKVSTSPQPLGCPTSPTCPKSIYSLP